MCHIYENPVETDVDLVPRILSLWTNIHKQMQATVMNITCHCKAYVEVSHSQFDSSCKLFENNTT